MVCVSLLWHRIKNPYPFTELKLVTFLERTLDDGRDINQERGGEVCEGFTLIAKRSSVKNECPLEILRGFPDYNGIK